MPWFKVDDAFHGHPKVMELSPAAVGIWTLAGTWCANYLTDGEIKTNVVRRFGATDEMIRELVDAGLWIDLGGAYQFKDWAEYQPLKEEVEAERNAARERMKEVRARKKGVERSPEQPPNVQPNNPGTFGGTSEEVRVTPALPIPSLPITTSPAETTADEFESWYARYPKKEAKKAAKTAFIKARKSASFEELSSGLDRYIVAVKGKDRQFIALPASWLNAGRWEDEAPKQEVIDGPWSKNFHERGRRA